MFADTNNILKTMFGNTVFSIFFAFAKVNFAVFSLFQKRMPLVGNRLLPKALSEIVKKRFVPIGTRPCITRYKRTKSSQCREKTVDESASRQGRDKNDPPKVCVMAH